MKQKTEDHLQILPIADTISGSAARENPERTLKHYNHLATQFWLSPKVSDVAEDVFSKVQHGYTTWGSLSGPYGFGKTASAISLWMHAIKSGFLAIPPLSCTNFNELAAGITSLVGVQNSKIKKDVDRLYKDVFTTGLNPIVHEDAKHYDVPSKKVRKIYQDKFSTGQFTLDSHPHRTVEFLSRLGELAAHNSEGLVIILDELQQLLGPLDARAIVHFREFVWGMRTERSSCGIILVLDSLLEARLARWAADILHRIRENGPTLQLTDIYTCEFPLWLWNQLTNEDRKSKLEFRADALSENILLSLGQLVERPDLANGPRTVVDVFSRAVIHHQETNASYDIPDLVNDVHQGRFRYFGEGATVQTILTQILSDEWILKDEGRKKMVTTLAAFPQGCPEKILHDQISDNTQIEKAKSELFGPLLVELSGGLALEPLQQVRRNRTDWEQILLRCWENLPSLDALVAHTPEMVRRILIPEVFPEGTPTKPIWESVSDESSAALTGWHILQGTFNDAYPKREVALYVAEKEPEFWPEDVDVSVALVCDTGIDDSVESRAELLDINDGSCILIRLPILKPLVDRIPADLQRYEKYVQPEPFRPVTILAALHDFEAFLGDLIDNPDNSETPLMSEEQVDMEKGKAIAKIAVDFLLRELMTGTVDIEIGSPISLQGPELLRALFIQACRRRFPDYQTLTTTAKWRNVLSDYRKGLKSDLSLAVRQGQEEIVMSKAEIYKKLFGQLSTAAGDSFIKKLGPFVETKNNLDSFSLRLTMHPAENDLIDYLKGLSNDESIPFDAAVEVLRHQGYIEDETEEIVKTLIARECLTIHSDHNIRFIRSVEIERKRLLDNIYEKNKKLHMLELTDNVIATHENISITNLQEHLNQQQIYLETAVERQVTDLKNNFGTLQNLIGTVTATIIPMEWLKSDLCMHLNGIATKLKGTQQNLLRTLYKAQEKVTSELDSSTGSSDVEWAIVQKDKNMSFFTTLQQLQERVTELEQRSKALTSWEVLNNQLSETDVLCSKVSKTESTPRQSLSQLVAEFKEQFATDLWDPLFTSSEFSDRLRSVQSDIQGLLYSYNQIFNKELAEIRNQFNSLLPSTSPPMFDVSVVKNQESDSINESFQKLYQWVFEGFCLVFTECQELKNSGVKWCNLKNKRQSWNKLVTEIEEVLQTDENALMFDMLQRIGEKVLLMQRGFTDVHFGVFDDPDKPPNFEELKRLFNEGNIKIQVTPKS